MAGETKALRWETLTASGTAVPRPARLYYARLAATASASALLRDGTTGTAPVVLALALGGAGADDWPRVPVSLPCMTGVYVSLTGAGTVLVGWDTD